MRTVEDINKYIKRLENMEIKGAEFAGLIWGLKEATAEVGAATHPKTEEELIELIEFKRGQIMAYDWVVNSSPFVDDFGNLTVPGKEE